MTYSPKELWQELTQTELTDFEAEMLLDMLTAAIVGRQHHVVVISYVDEEKEITDSVLTVTIIDMRNTIIGQVYEAPGRIVTAIFKDWLAPGINEDGTLDPITPEESDEFDRLIQAFNEEVESVLV